MHLQKIARKQQVLLERGKQHPNGQVVAMGMRRRMVPLPFLMTITLTGAIMYLQAMHVNAAYTHEYSQPKMFLSQIIRMHNAS